MATAYLSPGVFIEEIDAGARPIEAVGTSTAGFVGVAPNAQAHLVDPIAVNNWAQFLREFVRNGDKGTDLANAVYGFFLNGGARCYVVNTGPGGAISGKGKGLDLLSDIDEIAIIAAPGRTDVQAYSALLDNAEALKDRVAVLDGPQSLDDVEALTRAAEIESGPTGEKKDKDTVVRGGAGRQPGARPRNSDKGYGAFYFPWLRARDAVAADNVIVPVPPSGHIAGIYARTDSERGVHKAPANVAVRGALGVTRNVSREEQDVLNPAGVNVIRFFSREGVRVWGARTVAPSASNWRYLNVRRLFNMVEESIGLSTRWVVFEPNDRLLWNAIRRDVGAFLTLLWRQGALLGATPQEAFFVKCDEETNPPEVIDAGQVITVIGMAPVKPAEFVIFKVGQSQARTSVEAV